MMLSKVPAALYVPCAVDILVVFKRPFSLRLCYISKVRRYDFIVYTIKP